MTRRRPLAVAALCLAVVVGACGSGSGTEENPNRGVPTGPPDAGTSNGGTGPGDNQPLTPPETGGDK